MRGIHRLRPPKVKLFPGWEIVPVLNYLKEDPGLCPVYHLVRLEKRLKYLRRESETRFWLAARRPHQAVTVKTISRWLVEVIRGSGALGGMAKEVRSVGASTAVQASLDMKQIMKAADWQRLTTLQRHYFKPQTIQSLS